MGAAAAGCAAQTFMKTHLRGGARVGAKPQEGVNHRHAVGPCSQMQRRGPGLISKPCS